MNKSWSCGDEYNKKIFRPIYSLTVKKVIAFEEWIEISQKKIHLFYDIIPR